MSEETRALNGCKCDIERGVLCRQCKEQMDDAFGRALLRECDVCGRMMFRCDCGETLESANFDPKGSGKGLE